MEIRRGFHTFALLGGLTCGQRLLGAFLGLDVSGYLVSVNHRRSGIRLQGFVVTVKQGEFFLQALLSSQSYSMSPHRTLLDDIAFYNVGIC